MTESNQLAALIAHAARELHVCPHAVLTSLRLHRKNPITIARRCVMLHLFRSECPVDRIARIFKLSRECVVMHLRIARLMDDQPEYIAVLAALPAYTPPPISSAKQPTKRSHAAKQPI
jgi:hypothetical protein